VLTKIAAPTKFPRNAKSQFLSVSAQVMSPAPAKIAAADDREPTQLLEVLGTRHLDASLS
jgi:hypothetical protein